MSNQGRSNTQTLESISSRYCVFCRWRRTEQESTKETHRKHVEAGHDCAAAVAATAAAIKAPPHHESVDPWRRPPTPAILPFSLSMFVSFATSSTTTAAACTRGLARCRGRCGSVPTPGRQTSSQTKAPRIRSENTERKLDPWRAQNWICGTNSPTDP